MGITAIEKEIPIQRMSDFKEEWDKDKRSIILEPTATIDGNTIRIYTNMSVENMLIVIEDLSGNEIYTNVDYTSNRCHVFEIYDLPQRELTLKITIGDESFYGYFSI